MNAGRTARHSHAVLLKVFHHFDRFGFAYRYGLIYKHRNARSDIGLRKSVMVAAAARGDYNAVHLTDRFVVGRKHFYAEFFFEFIRRALVFAVHADDFYVGIFRIVFNKV